MSAKPLTRRMVLIALTCACIHTGCSRLSLHGDSEGTIEYAMTFPDLPSNSMFTDLLPEKALLSFNRDQQALDLSAGMGLFRSTIVVNTPSQLVDHRMSILGKKLAAEFTLGELMTANKYPLPLAVVYTAARDTIAGLPCKQAFLVYDSIDLPEAEVWYTEAIALERPNWYGPYEQIPGVLMRYELTQNNIRMRFEARSVAYGTVDNEKFAACVDYQRVSPEVLVRELGEVMGSLSQ